MLKPTGRFFCKWGVPAGHSLQTKWITATFSCNRVAGARLRSPGPLRTVREGFSSHSSSLSNAS